MSTEELATTKVWNVLGFSFLSAAGLRGGVSDVCQADMQLEPIGPNFSCFIKLNDFFLWSKAFSVNCYFLKRTARGVTAHLFVALRPPA